MFRPLFTIALLATTSLAAPAHAYLWQRLQCDLLFEPLKNRGEYIRIKNPAQQTAADVIAHVRTLYRPITAADRALYLRVRTYQHTPEFQNYLQQDPTVYRLIMTTADEMIRDQVVEIVRRLGRFMTDDDRALYKKFSIRRLRPEFQKLFENVPDVAAILFTQKLFSDATFDAIVQYIRHFQAVPTSSGQWALMSHYLRIKDTREFQQRLRKIEDVWSIFEQAEKDLSPEEWSLLKAELVKRNGPPLTRTHRKIANYYYLNRNTEEMSRALSDNPAALAVHLKNPPTEAELAAEESIRMAREQGRRFIESDGPAYSKYLRYRHDSHFINRIQTDEIAAPLHQNIELTPVERSIEDVFQHMLTTGETPHRDTDSALYSRYRRIKDSPQAISRFKEDPKVWKAYQDSHVTAMRLTALKLIEFMTQNGGLFPTIKTNQPLHKAITAYEKHPDFLAVINEDPILAQVWHEFTTVDPHFKMKGSKMADNALKYFEEHGHFKTSEEFAENVIEYLDNHYFVARMRGNPTAWKLFASTRLWHPRVVAVETIRFFMEHGTLPTEHMAPELSTAYKRRRFESMFTSELRRHRPTWLAYQTDLKNQSR